MTQEQYERAAKVKAEIENLEKAKKIFSYACQVHIVANEVAGFAILHDAGLNQCIKDYITKQIAELEKEFEEL